MISSCTAAAIVAALGTMPPPGTVISVPASAVAEKSRAEISHAKACARRYGIRWRIVEDR